MRKIENSELGRLQIDEFKEHPKNPLVLILDDIRSLNNVGSAFRTADAFILEKIYLCGITGTPPHREINKTALGATESVQWEHHQNIVTLIKELTQEGFQIVVIEQTDVSVSLTEFQPDPGQRYALIFGNEVFGVKDELLPLAHHCIDIPQYGTKHSLNISVCLGITVWTFLDRMQLLKP